MTLAAAMLGNGGRPGGWEARGRLPPILWAALVCEVANWPASLLPVGPCLDLVPAWQPVGSGEAPPRLAQYSPGTALLMGLDRNRPSAWLLEVKS